MLRVLGLTRVFGIGSSAVKALADVRLEVNPGEVVALVGRSGAGKTTLLTMIGALDSPPPGAVQVGGLDVGALVGDQLDDYRQRVVGYVYQSAGLLPLYTAAENVAMSLRICGVGRPDAVARAALALEQVGLSHRLTHRALELSGGEQQRVALARALVKNPALLLADEPTAQLDSETGADMLRLIRGGSAGGTAVLIATHDQAAVEAADRVYTIEDGLVSTLGA